MKRGFPADVSTLGGRIRQSRLDSGYTIKDFSGILNVSANHLGLVERGDKTPSPKLVRDISIAADTSYQWLIKGEVPAQEPSPAQRSSPAQAPLIVPDLQLLLGLILAIVPSVSKEILANLLNVSVATVDQILNDNNVDCDVERLARLSMLAGLLGDIPSVRNRLKVLDEFLITVEFDRNIPLLKEHFIQYIFQKCGQRFKLHTPVNSHISIPTANVNWTSMTLCKVDHPETIWKFYIIENPISCEDDADHKTAIEEICEYVMNEATKNDNEISLIFIAEYDFEIFEKAIDKEISKLDMVDAGCGEKVETSPYHIADYSNLSYFLVDSRTLEIGDFTCTNILEPDFWAKFSCPIDTDEPS